MDENIIYGVIYTEIDEIKGPNPIFYFPSNLPETIVINVGIKSITLLTAEKSILPESLVFIPFPSLKLKGIIKYIESPELSHRGNVILSAITLLFKEFDDIIFYKYIRNIESIFNEAAQNIIKLGKLIGKKEQIAEEILNLRKNILIILEDLRIKECSEPQSIPFPESKASNLEKTDYIAKVIVCGDPEVGKTSIILRYTLNAFKRTYLPSIGVNICEKTIDGEDYIFKFVIWDLAGQTKFQIMRKHFYKGADAALLVFDLTDLESFKSIQSWHQDLNKHLDDPANLHCFIIGNKSDLGDQREIDTTQLSNLNKDLNLEYIETSALTGENVELVFQKIADIFIETEKVLKLQL